MVDRTNCGIAGTGWSNVEFRSFEFADEDGENASIVETHHSRESRRGTEKPLTQTELMELKETAKKTLEAGGYHPLQAKEEATVLLQIPGGKI